MIKTQNLVLAATLLAISACSPREPVFNADRITEGVRTLSADSFEGRAPATAGEEKTVAYLIEQLKAAGVEPGGDPAADGKRAWTQDVPLLRSEIQGAVEASVRAGKETISLAQGEQVTFRASLDGANQVDIKDVPLVFVGYGVSAPERNWDDFKGVDLAGKVALILVNDPDFETGAGDFGGKAMTYYGRWTYKFEEMARRGAAGALVIHETEPASYGWATVKNSNGSAMFDVLRGNPKQSHVSLEGWIHRDATAELFKKAGLDFETLKKQAQERDFKPVELKGEALSVHFSSESQKVVTKNVVGVLKGTTHPDEWVLYTAHWDHLGVGEPDAKGDTIFNGAADNAAGVSQLLEIARNFAAGKRTQRSLGFIFVTAEERGLLGSEYYATSPLYPLAKTVAVLNTDSPSPTGPSRNFSTTGTALTTLQDLLVETAKEKGLSYKPDANPEAGLFFRSDHFSFAKRGVPAISYASGNDLVTGGVEASEAWSEVYRRDRYHQPADEFDEKTWRSDGIADHAAVLYAAALKLANSRTWPEWKEGAEFKAARDATVAERKQ